MWLENNKSDKDFAEYSWTQMRAMLDEEMPVKRNTDNSVVLLILLSLFAFFIGSYLNNKIDDLHIPSIDSIAQNEFNTNLSEHIDFGFKLEHGKDVFSNKTKAAIALFSSDFLRAEKSTSDQALIASDAEMLKDLASTEVLSNHANDQVIQIDELETLNPIVSHLNQERSQIEIDLIPSIKSVKIETKVATFNHSFGTLLASSVNKDYVAFGFSYKISKRLSQRVSIYGALNLTRFKQLSNPNTSNPRGPVFFPSGGGNGITSHYNNLDSYVDLSLPLGASFYLTKNLSFDTHVSFRKMILTELHGSAISIQNRQIHPKSNYNNFSVNPAFGFTYHLSNVLEFSSTFERASNTLVNSAYYSSERTKLHLLQIGMNYRF